jgi:hypothetical protein
VIIQAIKLTATVDWTALIFLFTTVSEIALETLQLRSRGSILRITMTRASSRNLTSIKHPDYFLFVGFFMMLHDGVKWYENQ